MLPRVNPFSYWTVGMAAFAKRAASSLACLVAAIEVILAIWPADERHLTFDQTIATSMFCCGCRWSKIGNGG